MNELVQLAKFYKRTGEWTRFRSCQAWVSNEIYNSATNRTIILVKSYNTIVGIVDVKERAFYELGKWSRTTSKQVTQIYNSLFNACDRYFIEITSEDRARL